MKVSEAIASRITCRAFTDQPVAEATVRAILDVARQAPSGGNVQPWHVRVLSGEPLRELVDLVEAKGRENWRGEATEYEVYPKVMPECYRQRVFQCGADLYATLDIAREDRAARRAHFARNQRFFDAPVGLFFALDRSMGYGQWADMGMFLQSVMLLAREHGLHSCPQEYWATWHSTVTQFLQLPPELMLWCGLGLGYMDTAAPVNRLRTSRAGLDEIASFSGF